MSNLPDWAKYQTVTLDIPNDVINQIVDYASTRDKVDKSVVITELIQAGLNNNLNGLIGTKQSSETANEVVVNELQHLIKIKDAHGLKSMWVVYELYRICRDLIGDIELREIAKSLDFGYLWLQNAWETIPERIKRSEKDDIPF